MHSTLCHIQLNLALNKRNKVLNEEGMIVDGKLSDNEQSMLNKEENRLFEQLESEEEQGRKKIREEGEHIHFVKDGSSCRHCRRVTELQRQEEQGQLTAEEQIEYKKKLHKALVQAQRGTMLLIKMKLEEGKAGKSTILLHQDFTQLVTAQRRIYSRSSYSVVSI